MTADLRGVRAKLSRANKHLSELEAVITAWYTTQDAVSMSFTSPHPEGQLLTVVTQVAPLPPEIPLVVGDIVHNLRCALDHVVCQLAVAAGNSSACNKTQFPIFITSSPADLQTISRYLKPLDPLKTAAADAIKDLQPYKRSPSNPASDDLWLISALDNLDKHRMLVVLAEQAEHFVAAPGAYGLRRDFTPSKTWEKERGDKHLFGAEFIVPAGGRLNTHPQTVLSVRFQQTGLVCDGERVLPTTQRLIRTTQGLVADFESQGFFA